MFGRCLILLVVVTLSASATGFEVGGRWTETASGGEGQMGSPVNVTWSIVPDGTIIPGRGTSNLISWLDTQFAVPIGQQGPLASRPWFNVFSSAATRWHELGGVNFIYEAHDDALAHGNFFGELGFRGDIRFGGAYVDGPGNTLAYAGLVNQADIVIDTSDQAAFFGSSSDNKFRNTLMHELGHSLGLMHVNSPGETLLLEPFVDSALSGPQLDDIAGLHRLYGDAYDAHASNGTLGTATSLGSLPAGGSLTIGASASNLQQVAAGAIDFASISTAMDQDWFSFAVDLPTSIDVLLTPLGGTFDQSSDVNAMRTINATSRNNLTLTLFGPNALTLVDASFAAAAGQPELLNDAQLHAAGTYYVRVTGGTDAQQFYRLDVTRAAAPLAGDYNHDGSVDAADFTLWRDLRGTTAPAADGNGSGLVDGADYDIWQGNFGSTTAASTTAGPANVPEPSSLACLLGVVAAIFVRRRVAKTPSSAE